MISTDVKNVIQKHLSEKLFSACALGIQSFGEAPEFFTIGKTSLDPSSQNIDSKSLFDIASITKVMFTANLAADLFEKDKLDLKEKLGKWIPNSFYTNYSLEQLMMHQARFRPGLRFPVADPNLHQKPDDYRAISNRLMGVIAKSSIAASPQKMIYSDPGYILLAEILSHIAGESSEDSWKKLQESMGLTTTKTTAQIKDDDVVVATDMELKRGQVHDPDALYIGKLCGHAGLFSSIEDVVKFGSIWLDDYFGKKRRFQEETVRRFIDPYVGHDRALGWDIPSANSTAGAISKKSIGHLGFTGTSLWVDLEKKRIVSLLTNRVIMGYGKGNEEEFKKRVGAMNTFRREVHKSIWESCFNEKDL
ncbi:MAG: serine hydrolase [Proteobacteria bacterium]|jgi:CubicO group peptidase (beta-lactamase class C family)|nr:serine hydrolase [Pseudomonadota bacterium]